MLLSESPLRADSIAIGQLVLSVDGSTFQPQIQISNYTDTNCEFYFDNYSPAGSTVCSPVSITNWTLTVDYLDPSNVPQEFSSTAGSTDNIDASSTAYTGPAGDPWTFGDPLDPSTFAYTDTITKVTFSGTITPLTVSDLYNGTHYTSTFFAESTFTTVLTPSGGPSLQLGDYGDLLVNSATSSASGGPTPVPEPSSLALSIIGLSAVAGVLRRR